MRHLHGLAICLLVGFGSTGAHSQTPVTKPPTVRLNRGLLEGIRLGGLDGEAAFLGVPYAKAPVGDLRWKPPQPAEEWAGTRMATDFGSPCPQLPARWFQYIPGNEDCLYLNVWTPELSSNRKLPVLVYFHGGSNTQGYSQMTPLGLALSRLGMVVVSTNYRLGPFGFFAHPALTAESEHHSSGNYGLLDQLQALQWVGENISHFGGDPGRVTVMGQSAGAVDICLLMASPAAEGLFQGAIMESGEGQSVFNEDIRTFIPYNFISRTGEANGQLLVKDLGLSDGPDLVQKLRRIPADEILKAWTDDRTLHFDAIVDGWVIPKQPATIFAEGKQMLIPIIVGSNADEAAVFGHNDVQTVDQYKDYLQQDTGKYSDLEFQLYPVMSAADVPAQYLRLQNDSFAYGAYSLARAMTHARQEAFLYYFTYSETGKRSRLGAYHGEELYFLSDSYPADWEHTQAEARVGQEVRTYWAQFAKTGNPNDPSLPRWPPYDLQSSEYLELGRKLDVRPVAPQLRQLEGIMQRVLADVRVRE
jgi:para-nitrobenzyl esterase